MGHSSMMSQLSGFFEGDDMTGKQAVLLVAAWMGATALFEMVSYILVFVIMGF